MEYYHETLLIFINYFQVIKFPFIFFQNFLFITNTIIYFLINAYQ